MAVANPFGDFSAWTPKQQEADRKRIQARGRGDVEALIQGRHVYRFLPGKPGQGSPFRETHDHWMEDGDGKFAVACLAALEPGRRCIIDPAVDQLASSASATDQKAADDLAVSSYGLGNACVKLADGSWDSPKTYKLPWWGVYKVLVGAAMDPEAGIDFTHPVNGCNVVIAREGSNMKTKYTVTLARETTQLQVLDAIQTQADITKLVEMPTREKLERASAYLADLGFTSGPVIEHKAARAMTAPLPTGPTAADDIAGPTEDDLSF